jgi:hypothetical protein
MTFAFSNSPKATTMIGRKLTSEWLRFGIEKALGYSAVLPKPKLPTLDAGLENLPTDRKATALLLRQAMLTDPRTIEMTPYFNAYPKTKTITAQKAIVEAKQTTLAQEVFGPIWKFLNQKIF